MFHNVARNCKANPDIACTALAVARTEQNRVDADELSIEADERSPGIARIDRGIGLDEATAVTFSNGPIGRTDDTARDRLAKAEGVSDRDNIIAHLELAAVTKWEGRQVCRAYFQYSKVKVGGDTQGLRRKLASVLQGNFDLLGLAHHMKVCNYKAALAVDDNPGTGRHGRLKRRIRHSKIAAKERILEKRVLLGWRRLQDGNTDDRR